MGLSPALGRYVTGLKYGTVPLTAGTVPEPLQWCRSRPADALRFTQREEVNQDQSQKHVNKQGDRS